jgi:hypothetical protein
MRQSLTYAYLFLLISLPFCLSAQTDTLILINDDIIVGEVKFMNRGVLEVETDYSDADFKIEWDKIKSIVVNNSYLITLSSGEIINGRFFTTQSGLIVITDGDGLETAADQDEIVYIKKVEQSFLSRLDASIDIGYSFTKAQNVNQISGRTALGYLANTWSVNAFYNSVLTAQDSVDNISRNEGQVQFKQFLPKDFYIPVTINVLTNTEQQLELRTTGQLGIGKYFIHSNQAYLTLDIGGAYVSEQFSNSETGDRNSWESYASIALNLFDIGDVNLKTTGTLFPSLTERGRARVNYSLDFKYDLPLDFYIGTGLSLNFDNEPAENASRLDYVIQSSVGWEW